MGRGRRPRAVAERGGRGLAVAVIGGRGGPRFCVGRGRWPRAVESGGRERWPSEQDDYVLVRGGVNHDEADGTGVLKLKAGWDLCSAPAW